MLIFPSRKQNNFILSFKFITFALQNIKKKQGDSSYNYKKLSKETNKIKKISFFIYWKNMLKSCQITLQWNFCSCWIIHWGFFMNIFLCNWDWVSCSESELTVRIYIIIDFWFLFFWVCGTLHRNFVGQNTKFMKFFLITTF